MAREQIPKKGVAMNEDIFSPEQREELNELRKRQIGGGSDPFDEEGRERLLELTKLENAARHVAYPLNKEEEKEYLRLTREQIEGQWTPEKSKKLLEFRKRKGLD